ncbi:MAG: HD domain-containing protein [Patescibacteria group bacterium]
MYKYLHPEKVKIIYEELGEEAGTQQLLELLKSHHKETYEHCLRVAKLSIDLALENGLPADITMTIGKAALLHDFGKSKINKKLLTKPGPLNSTERFVIDEHPRLGLSELKKHLSPEECKIIASHHDFEMKISLRKLFRGRAESYSAQIVAAADMYDALRFARSYKESYELGKVKKIMEGNFTGQKILIKQLANRKLKSV